MSDLDVFSLEEPERCPRGFEMKNQLTWCTFKNPIPQFCGWVFISKQAKNFFCWRNFDFYVVYQLSFCELTGNILQNFSSIFQPLERSSETFLYEFLKINIRNCANGGIFLRNSGNRWYFSRKLLYMALCFHETRKPLLLCYDLPGTFFFFRPLMRLYCRKNWGKCSVRAVLNYILWLLSYTRRNMFLWYTTPS